MQNIRKGDKVVTVSHSFNGNLVLGKEYTVRRITKISNGYAISLEERPGFCFWTSYFIVIPCQLEND